MKIENCKSNHYSYVSQWNRDMTSRTFWRFFCFFHYPQTGSCRKLKKGREIIFHKPTNIIFISINSTRNTKNCRLWRQTNKNAEKVNRCLKCRSNNIFSFIKIVLYFANVTSTKIVNILKVPSHKESRSFQIANTETRKILKNAKSSKYFFSVNRSDTIG